MTTGSGWGRPPLAAAVVVARGLLCGGGLPSRSASDRGCDDCDGLLLDTLSAGLATVPPTISTESSSPSPTNDPIKSSGTSISDDGDDGDVGETGEGGDSFRRLPSRAAVEVKTAPLLLWRRTRKGDGESSNEAPDSVAEVELGREPREAELPVDKTDAPLVTRCSDRARRAALTPICGP